MDLEQFDNERRKRLDSIISQHSSESAAERLSLRSVSSRTPSTNRQNSADHRRLGKQVSIISADGLTKRNSVKGKEGEIEKPEKSGRNIIEIEKSEIGSVKWSVYMVYLKANGYFLTFLVLLFYALANGFQVGANVWLASWSDEAKNYKNQSPPDSSVRLAGYAGLGFGQGIQMIPC